MKSTEELKFDAGHVYSSAPEAARKRKIDLDFIGNDFRRGNDIRIDNEVYLKYLISTASGGKSTAGPSAKPQFFIIRGGAEGFLPTSLRALDAGHVVEHTGVTTRGKAMTFTFDHNDLLAVFNVSGSLISSARLERPLFITGMWSQKTADAVYNAWANKEVFIYKNTSFDVPYLGLGVKDGFRGHAATVDMHKQEATNGCIFIVDPNTPAYGDAKLGSFEPRLIRDVLSSAGIDIASVGKKQVQLGVIRVVKIL